MDQGFGTGLDINPLVDQGPEVFVGDMLVIEGDHVDAGGELPQGFQIPVVADRGLGDGSDCRDLWPLGQNPQVKTEVRCFRGHHSGKLATTDHANHRKIHLFRVPNRDQSIGRDGALNGGL